MKIALVILNWNGEKLLEKFLPFIVAHSSIPNVSIWVADNASTDNSINFLKDNYPEINIVQNKSNGGYAKGYNEALQHINADVYGLINSDIEVSKNWLKPIISTFKNEKETAIIQPKILDYKNKSKFEYAGAAGGFVDKFGYPYCRGRIFNELETDHNQFNDVTDIFWASGACLFIKSDVFHQLNGFDEDYFAHQEEIDLCWRAQNRNYSIKYVGTSTVYHVGGATLQESNPRKTFLNFRNSLNSLIKNVPTSKVFFIVLVRLILDGIAGIKFLAELRPIHTWAIVKAHFSFYYYLPKTLKKRKAIQKKESYFSLNSIVWEHFIKRKNKFSEL
ncbi:glycosyltransferase family 2 protein [Lutibacter sp. TH_r2]|uniref:glycosyltransferase family 2 protein n=1 Tax=Lutibacter sp. TH_r2 TaxID=3082083 RepID=UPI002955A0BC|nr:glycosyltransferase family 2 protein [Lutibacter sp. TH_r2]MDV7188111.1 glycosyltransferase family 2 protein [Lutibacter sp. TH_r2]